mmetsp:Transcript_24417/g.75955  ORF Transcript_24417/g.75955 Transcript_24417/m.75955 type:complete len:259 (+) Transcript_24417:541-1317(+)
MRDLLGHNVDPQLLDSVHQGREQLRRLHQLLRRGVVSRLLRLEELLEGQPGPHRQPQLPDPQAVLQRLAGPMLIEDPAGERPAVLLQLDDLDGENQPLLGQALDLHPQRVLDGVALLLVLRPQPLLLLVLQDLYEAVEGVEDRLLLVDVEDAVSHQLPRFVLHQPLCPDQSMQDVVVDDLKLFLRTWSIPDGDGQPVEPGHGLLRSHGRLLPPHEPLLQEGARLCEGVLKLNDLGLEVLDLRVGPIKLQLQSRKHLLR